MDPFLLSTLGLEKTHIACLLLHITIKQFARLMENATENNGIVNKTGNDMAQLFLMHLSKQWIRIFRQIFVKRI